LKDFLYSIRRQIKKITRFDMYTMTVLQLLAPVWLIVGAMSSAEWYWWLVALFFYFMHTGVGHNVGLHRYYTHRNFEMSKWTERFVLYFSVLSCFGSPATYAGVHSVHHKYSDTPLDPHGRHRGLRSVIYYFHRRLEPDDIMVSKRIIELVKRFKWLHEYYWAVLSVNALILYLISWKALLFCWLIPSSLCLWCIGVVLLMQHDANGANNSRAYMTFGCGEGWHKNHHLNPNVADNADPGKIDWTYRLCKIFAKKVY
jgi:sn-1 stearoyl-lipid 9-desaturase